MFVTVIEQQEVVVNFCKQALASAVLLSGVLSAIAIASCS